MNPLEQGRSYKFSTSSWLQNSIFLLSTIPSLLSSYYYLHLIHVQGLPEIARTCPSRVFTAIQSLLGNLLLGSAGRLA
jgi:hypothetical protein